MRPSRSSFPISTTCIEFSEWSPWQLRDPQLAVSYAGPEQGKGATVQWTSQVKSVGNGSMEITESEPSRHIDLAVIFNGLDGTSSYDISPSGSGSKVTWAFGYDSGTSPLKRWKALDARRLCRRRISRRPRSAQGEDRSGTPPDGADCQRDPAGRDLDRVGAAFRRASAWRRAAARCGRGAWPAGSCRRRRRARGRRGTDRLDDDRAGSG